MMSEVVGNSVEDLQWLNYALEHLWPEMEEVAMVIVQTKVSPMMNEKAPKGEIHNISFSKFTLGKIPAIIGPVTCTRLPQGAARIRFNVDYLSDMFMELRIETHLGSFHVGMKNFQIQGALAAIVRPFIHEFPGTGSGSICFIEAPRIDFTLSGMVKFANFGGMKEKIIDIMGKVLEDLIVIPNVLTILMNFKTMAVYPPVFESPPPIGVLRVTLQKVNILKNAKADATHAGKTNRKQGLRMSMQRKLEKVNELVEHGVGKLTGTDVDPYLKFVLGGDVWHTGFKQVGVTHNFTVFDTEQKLNVSLWDKDLASSDDHMGNVGPFSIEEAREASEKAQKIMGGEGDTIGMILGDVQLKVQWYEAEAATVKHSECLVVVRARELQGGSALEGKDLALRVKLGDEVKITKKASNVRDRMLEGVNAKVVEIREKLKKSGVDDAVIEDACQFPAELTRMTINRSLYFTADTKSIDSTSLEFSLVELAPKPEGKSKKLHEPKVVGQQLLKLKDYRHELKSDAVEKLSYTGPLGDISLEIDVDILTLRPQL